MFKQLMNSFGKASIKPDGNSVPEENQIASMITDAFHLYETGSLEDAKNIFFQVLSIDKSNADAHYFIAEIYSKEGKLSSALKYYNAARILKPDFVEAYINLAHVLRKSDDLIKAKRLLIKAIDINPENADLYNNLGIVYLETGDISKAKKCFYKASMLNPGLASAYLNLGIIFQHVNKIDKSLKNFYKAIELDPDNYFVNCNIGLALREQGKTAEAKKFLDKAIRIDPNAALAYCNKGLVLLTEGVPEQAISYYNKTLELNPDFAEAYVHTGLALRELGRLDDALVSFEKALSVRADFPEAKLNRGFIRLLKGEYEKGWPDYLQRISTNEVKYTQFVDYPYPKWDGSPPEDKTLLITSEQGLGDQIMFASCLPDVISTCKYCIIQCEPRLEQLFINSFCDDNVRVVSSKENLVDQCAAFDIDFQIPLGNLPLYYRRAITDFPQHTGYLSPEMEQVNKWKKRLDALGEGLKVGISWRGGIERTRRAIRSIELENLETLLIQDNIHFISLQYTECQHELEKVKSHSGIEVHHWQKAIDDYSETAALVSALDLVISVQTSVIHLAGALGKPAWVLVPASPEWRYGHEGSTMPWYPSVTLFRQEKLYDWNPVIGKVAEELQKLDVQNL